MSLHIPPGVPEWGVLVHIGTAGIGLVAGCVAILAPKGRPVHRAAGSVFVLAMLTTSAIAAWLAALIPQRGVVVGAVVLFYLVASAWMTARRPEGRVGRFEVAAMAAIFAAAGVSLLFGLQTAAAPGGRLDGYPPQPLYALAGIAAFAGLLDLSVILRGGVSGVARTTRHLWRMSLALLYAAVSFLGQQKSFPDWVQGSPALYVLPAAILALMLFWLVRVRVSRTSPA